MERIPLHSCYITNMADKKSVRSERKRKSVGFLKGNWNSFNVGVNFSPDIEGFSGLEELTSYNEEDLQAFITSKKSKKKGKDNEEETDILKDNKQENEDGNEGVKNNEDNEDQDENRVIKKMTRKERKKIERKAYRLQKLKEKRAKFRDERKKRRHEMKITETNTITEEKEEGIEDTNLDPTDQEQRKMNFDEDTLKEAVGEWLGLGGVPNEILQSLSESNFTIPTEIQKRCIPEAILNCRDVIGAAETGSGKTLAFGIPLITNIMQMKKRQKEKKKENKHLKGLVITPTRELALQIQDHFKAISKYTDISTCSIVGGMSTEKQQRLLERSPDIVIATPGRLMQLINSGHPHLSYLNRLKFLVVDECDRMFEKGHFTDLNDIIDKINCDRGKVRKQIFVFSATLTLQQQQNKNNNTNDIKELLKKIGLSPKAATVDLTQKHVAATTLRQMKVVCNNEERESYLMYFLLQNQGRTILFTNTISETKKLCAVLDLLKQKPLQLHAGKQQKQRLKCLERFKCDDNGLLVCTDVAARGLDIPDVENVVHFRLPKDPKIYIHRSGRTARAKKDGLSLILEGPEDFSAYKKISSFMNLESELPLLEIDRGLFDAIDERVRLAKSIEKLTFRARKESSDESWMNRVSKAMEIDGDFSACSGDNEKQKMLVKNKQLQLNKLLKTKLFSSQFSGNYPTKFGDIVTPSVLPTK